MVTVTVMVTCRQPPGPGRGLWAMGEARPAGPLYQSSGLRGARKTEARPTRVGGGGGRGGRGGACGTCWLFPPVFSALGVSFSYQMGGAVGEGETVETNQTLALVPGLGLGPEIYCQGPS